MYFLLAIPVFFFSYTLAHAALFRKDVEDIQEQAFKIALVSTLIGLILMLFLDWKMIFLGIPLAYILPNFIVSSQVPERPRFEKKEKKSPRLFPELRKTPEKRMEKKQEVSTEEKKEIVKKEKEELVLEPEEKSEELAILEKLEEEEKEEDLDEELLKLAGED